MTTRTWTALILSVCLLSQTASAQPVDPAKAQAQAALREGNTLLEQGRAEDALAKFTEAYRLFASPKIHYNIGQAESSIPGHEAQAYEAMSRFLSQARDASADLRAAAEAQRHQLRPKLGLVSVTADPADVDLLVDGADVGRITAGAPVVLGIGTHTLMLKKGSSVSGAETAIVNGGETLNMRLVLASPGPSPSPVVPAPVPPALPVPLPATVASGASLATPSSTVLSSPAPASPEDDRRPVYRKAWFWGAIGAVVLAGGLTALLVRPSGQDPAPSLGEHPVGGTGN